MAVVKITINGHKIEAQSGQTVLEAASDSGIYIPTLCHHPAVQPQGSCRMCLVEIERQRGLQPACTFPVSEGMVISTHTEKVESARRFVLELLFSERIHYCMYCPMSGDEQSTDCELQRLAYEYGLANWEYAPNTKRRWPVDASRKYFVMDHSRCILCRRCIRACDEIAANHTLGVRDRGTRTMVIADADVPFGKSSCVSCGTCLQVCPTGALMDRRSAYMGHHTDVVRTEAFCAECPVTCGIEPCVRDNMLLRVESDWDAATGGLLCEEGRFGVVEPQPARVLEPMIRQNGQLAPATWDEALDMVARRLQTVGLVAGLASPRATNEELAAFRNFFEQTLQSSEMGLLYGAVPPLDLGTPATLADLNQADCVVLVGGQPLAEQKVVGYTLKRLVDRGACLITVGDGPAEMDVYATRHLSLEQIASAAAEIAAAQHPMVLYAAGLAPTVYEALQALPATVRFMPLYRGTNAAGAALAGLKATPVRGAALYVLAVDEVSGEQALPEAEFTVVQSAYQTAWTEAADVVLPALTWAEKDGHLVNLERRELPLIPFLKPATGLQPAEVALARLAERMGIR